jgi:biopolymer transport protein ExbB
VNHIWTLLQQGGLLMIPIIAASLISFIIFFERIWSLRSDQVIPKIWVQNIMDLIQKGQFKQALTVCKSHPSTAAVILKGGLEASTLDRTHMKEAFEEVGQVEVSYLGRYIEVLGTIATITPLIGLLGTVVGMIDVFRTVVDEVALQGGGVNPASLAAGIWVALITTAAGLTAAIPAFIGYKYLLSHIEKLAIELEEISLLVLELVYPKKAVHDRPTLSDPSLHQEQSTQIEEKSS